MIDVRQSRSSPWHLVVGSTISLIVSAGPVLQFTFGVFVKPVGHDIGGGRGVVSLALTCSLACTALCTPFAGRLMDKYGVRVVCLTSIALLALTLLALGAFVHSALSYVLVYALAGAFAAGQSPLPYAKAVAGAFRERRGLALGITMTGVGFGVMLLPPLSQYCIAVFGWRLAYQMLGLLLLAMAFPAVFFLVRERDDGGPPASEAAGQDLKQALRTGIFWQLAIAVFFVALASSGIFTHIVPMLTDRGTLPRLAARAISIGGIALIIGRLTSGLLLDRLPAKFVACGFFTLPLIGIMVILNTQGVDLPLAGTFLVGLGLGAEVDMMAYLISFYLGRRAFGEIYGYLFFAFMAGSSLGPLVMGISFSRKGSYDFGLQVLIAGLIVAIAVTSQIRGARPSAGRMAAEPRD